MPLREASLYTLVDLQYPTRFNHNSSIEPPADGSGWKRVWHDRLDVKYISASVLHNEDAERKRKELRWTSWRRASEWTCKSGRDEAPPDSPERIFPTQFPFFYHVRVNFLLTYPFPTYAFFLSSSPIHPHRKLSKGDIDSNERHIPNRSWRLKPFGLPFKDQIYHMESRLGKIRALASSHSFSYFIPFLDVVSSIREAMRP